MPAYTLHITLTLTGPVLTAATAPGGYGLDAVFARDPMPPTGADGQPVPGEHFILPGSLIRGRLRQSWEELNSVFDQEADRLFDIEALLGPDPMNDQRNPGQNTNQPHRGRLRFDNFRACAVAEPVRTRHRIAINALTGAAEEQMLQLAEAPWGSGAEVTFTGAIRCVAEDTPAAEALSRCVEVGLRWVPQFGGERGLGFGANAGVAVTVKPSTGSTTPPPAADIANATALAVVITPRAPFLLAKHRHIENVFEGRDLISGAAIKGAVAELWREESDAPRGTPVREFGRSTQPELAEHFDALVFLQAFPAAANRARRTRPVVPPLSLVKVGDALKDLAGTDGPVLLHRKAPAFAVDWKSRADVEKAFGWPELPLPREQRLGTAIDREKNRARDEALFGKECVIPAGHEWLARVNFSAVPAESRAKVAAQLAELLARGLDHLGKTKVRTTIEVMAGPSVASHIGQTLAAQNGQYIVTLQTPALLGWPEALPAFPGVEAARWKPTYADVWLELSGGALTCQHHFASQSFAGGEYLWRRFQKHRNCPYNPWLLTDPGSVFVLRVAEGRQADVATSFIAVIAARGLPIPSWARLAHGLVGDPTRDWRACPYLPENGFGEVAVNLDAHRKYAPRADEFTPLNP